MPDAEHATLALSFHPNDILKPGDSVETFRSFVAVHQGDYFQTLQAYSAVMQAQGVHLAAAPDCAFEPIWCAWGYGRTFTPTQVDGALPVVKKLGFAWVGVDDGWQTIGGDWALLPAKFPNGDADMRALVDKIHAARFSRAALVGAAGGQARFRTGQESPRGTAAERGRFQAEDLLLERLVSLSGERRRNRIPSPTRDQDVSRLGLRRPEARRPAHERRAALLQPSAQARPPGGLGGGAAQVLSR